MKKKKLAVFIASGTMVGSLLLGGNAYAATERSIPAQVRGQNTEYSRNSRKQNTSAKKTSGMRHLMSTSTPRFVGTIQTINGSSFTILGMMQWNNHPFAFKNGKMSPKPAFASSTTIAYTVNTSDATVYMKNGKLDSLNDLAIGQRVMITGTLDSTMSIVQAKGINIIKTSSSTVRDRSR
jgi:hypothetical protein